MTMTRSQEQSTGCMLMRISRKMTELLSGRKTNHLDQKTTTERQKKSILQERYAEKKNN